MPQVITHYLQVNTGEQLAVYAWPVPETCKGLVCMLDSYSGYCMRLESVAKWLYTLGYWTIGYDAYGHGRSDGKRGDVPDGQRNVDDLAAVLDFARQLQPAVTLPKTYFLSSGSGCITGSLLVRQRLRNVDGLIFISPVFQLILKPWQVFASNIKLLRYLPFIRYPTQLEEHKITRNAQAQSAYVSDPMLIKHIYPRSFFYILDNGKALLEQASDWNVPTCMVFSESDTITDLEVNHAFVRNAPQSMVQATVLKDAYHYILYDPDKELALEAIQKWLEEQEKTV